MLIRLRRPSARRAPVDFAGRPMAERRRVILKNEGDGAADEGGICEAGVEDFVSTVFNTVANSSVNIRIIGISLAEVETEL